MADRPLRPAAAYTAVAAMLLPTYFLRQPPRAGVILEITGSDGVPTQWAFDNAATAIIADRARAQGLKVRPLGTYPSQ